MIVLLILDLSCFIKKVINKSIAFFLEKQLNKIK